MVNYLTDLHVRNRWLPIALFRITVLDKSHAQFVHYKHNKEAKNIC